MGSVAKTHRIKEFRSLNTNSIKCIETSYKGILFRSRQEARTAVFLDAIGIKWEYEKEGYVLPADETKFLRSPFESALPLQEPERIYYLPDFYIPEQSRFHECFIEVKGKHPEYDEHVKAMLLAKHSKLPVYFIFGFPFIDDSEPEPEIEHHIIGLFPDVRDGGDKGRVLDFWEMLEAEEKKDISCDFHPSWDGYAWGRNDAFCEFDGKIMIANQVYFSCKIADNGERVEPCIEAYNKARSARFDNFKPAVVPFAVKAVEPKAKQLSSVNNWDEIISAMNLAGTCKQLAINSVLVEQIDSECKLLIDPSYPLLGSKPQENLQNALRNYFNNPELKLTITTGKN